ncbi:MAG: drug/metabolite transporter [Deferribacteraceae bacterium]|jgi:drug/metabolite transporter (DMT)-like permease|nr:drug/metabolite transporter [Deferribacteraceae bacterium]
MNKKALEYLADLSLLFISLVWGSTFIIVKESIEKVDPSLFISYRFLIASLILSPFLIIRRNKVNKESVLAGLSMGSVLFTVFYFQTFALKYITASVTGFLTGIYTLFVPILSYVFLHKKPYPTSIAAVILSTIGLYLISFQGNFTFGIGESFAIINAFGIAIHIILTDYYSKKYDTIILTSVQIIVVAFLSIIFTFASGIDIKIQPEKDTIFALILTGFLATVVAFFIQTAMQKYTTPTKAAILFTLEPVSSAFFGYLIGKEVLAFNQYIGASIIIIAMLVSEVGSALIRSKR